ncbi:MAG TPA: hypothetical protein P5511_00380 [Candidatus Goldiibacteriota bacterium]|nr:hypothetical protein [Candidatus Goldiibacteriota bacterium]
MAEETMQLVTYLMAVLAGVLFWLGFMFFGFVAQRYSRVFNRATFHGILMAAPVGILGYVALLIIKSAVFARNQEAGAFLQTAAYISLLISGALCLAGTLKFNGVLNALLRDREAGK